MNRVFVIYVEWDNTKGNHSGMAYLCQALKIANPSIRVIKFPRIEGKGSFVFNRALSCIYALYLLLISDRADKVFLMEYLTKNTGQEAISLILKFTFPKMKVMGMVHLSGKHLLEQHGSEKKILNYLKSLDYVYVMGSSLLDYLIRIGVNENKVIQTFHYVDDNFYTPDRPLIVHDRLRVICIGNLKRNFSLLKEIVTKCDDVDFDICQGVLDLDYMFGSLKNVRLHSFLPEPKLRDLMRRADISLCVMEDTVGSNVITTSLACGLAMVVSDVGSIRDYCNQTNTIFCETSLDFIDAIYALCHDRSRCLSMKKESLTMSQKYSLANFNNSFNNSIEAIK